MKNAFIYKRFLVNRLLTQIVLSDHLLVWSFARSVKRLTVEFSFNKRLYSKCPKAFYSKFLQTYFCESDLIGPN